VSHYKSNLRDIEFNLFELFNVQDYLGTGLYEDMDADTAREILSEVERIATARTWPRRTSTRTATRRCSTPKTNTAPAAGVVQEVLRHLDGVRLLGPGPARGDRRHHRAAVARVEHR
jgi:hypothetical protein